MNVSFSNFILKPSCVAKSYATPFLGGKKAKNILESDTFEKQNVGDLNQSEARKVISDRKRSNIDDVKPWAKRLEDDAETAFLIFSKRMKNIFRSDCAFKDNTFSNFPDDNERIGRLKLDVKSKHSLIEKMLGNEYKSEAEAREDIQDAIRGRIVLEHGTQKEGDEICKKLIEAVNSHKLEVKEITYYYSNEEEKYISNKMLNRLKKAINNEYGEGSCDFRQIQKSSGYNGLHLIFKIDNDFSAELQVLGPKVEALKDVEDVFYKLRHSKNVDKKYEKIKEKYKTLDKQAKVRLEAYSREAYLAQRRKELDGSTDDKFVPLDPKYRLPEIFDFNYIASL